VALLVGVEVRVVAQDVVEGGEEEPASAARGIANPHIGTGLHHVDHR
jgi:hypothetical protein